MPVSRARKNITPDFATATVRVEDSAHPVVKGLPVAFTIENDEWYTYDRSPRPDVHVLANVDENSYEPPRSVKMGDHPVIWTNQHYKGRNVYFQFGHKPELFESAMGPGRGFSTDKEEVRVVRELLEAGYADRLLLCAEVAMKTCYKHYGGWGYSHVYDNIIPWLKSLGASDTETRRMMVDNPRRLHAVG